MLFLWYRGVWSFPEWAGLCDLLDQENMVEVSLCNFQGWVKRSLEFSSWASWNTCSKIPNLPSKMCSYHIREITRRCQRLHQEREGSGWVHASSQGCQGIRYVNKATWIPQISIITSWMPWRDLIHCHGTLNIYRGNWICAQLSHFSIPVPQYCDIIKSCCLASLLWGKYFLMVHCTVIDVWNNFQISLKILYLAVNHFCLKC